MASHVAVFTSTKTAARSNSRDLWRETNHLRGLPVSIRIYSFFTSSKSSLSSRNTRLHVHRVSRTSTYLSWRIGVLSLCRIGVHMEGVRHLQGTFDRFSDQRRGVACFHTYFLEIAQGRGGWWEAPRPVLRITSKNLAECSCTSKMLVSCTIPAFGIPLLCEISL